MMRDMNLSKKIYELFFLRCSIEYLVTFANVCLFESDYLYSDCCVVIHLLKYNFDCPKL